MDWTSLIREIQEHGLMQTEIGERLGRSQAWVSAVAQGKYSDLRWSDGNALIALHHEIVGDPDRRSGDDRRHSDRREAA